MIRKPIERRAISGILQVILIVAIVTIAGASLAVFALDMVDTGTIMDSVEIGKISLSKDTQKGKGRTTPAKSHSKTKQE